MRQPLGVAVLTLSLLSACGGGGGGTGPATDPPPVPLPQPSALGAPLGAAVTAAIGPAGGTLGSPDGRIRIDIPAEARIVGLQEITNTSPAGFGHAYRLTPEGTTFSRPVRVTFHFTGEEVRGTTLGRLRVNSRTPEGYWTPAPTQSVDEANGNVVVETTHFSDWSPLPGEWLMPWSATVKVGERLPLEVQVCEELPGLKVSPRVDFTVSLCGKSELFGRLVKNWSVSGGGGGNATPARVPPGNPVAVSAQYTALSGAQVTLVSQVTVRDAQPGWQGTITYTESGSQPWNLGSGYVGQGELHFEQKRVFTVVGVKAVNGPTTTLFLKEAAAARSTDIGHKEKKVYAICQAGGPEVPQHWWVYDRNRRLEASAERTTEGKLYLSEGQYSLFPEAVNLALTGNDAVVDTYKNGCESNGYDNSFSKEATEYAAPKGSLAVKGAADPGNPNHSHGGADLPTNTFTRAHLEWDLTRVP